MFFNFRYFCHHTKYEMFNNTIAIQDRVDNPKTECNVFQKPVLSGTEEKAFVPWLITSLCCRYIILSGETNTLEGNSQHFVDYVFQLL